MTAKTPAPQGNRTGLLVLAWAWVALPFGYGVVQLFTKLVQLFGN